jgi:hypothetical protein
MASVGGDIKPSVAVASAAPAAPAIDNVTYLSTFPDVRTAAPVTVASATTTSNPAPADPVFRSLFQAGPQPVSQAVRELWGNGSSLTSDKPSNSVAVASAATVAPLPAKPANGGMLDLFSDRNGTFSG